MKESVAIAKEANTKKEYLPTRSGNSIHRVRNEPERQISSLRRVIGNIRRDGSTPSVDSIATELSSMPVAQRASVLLALQRTHGNRYVQRVNDFQEYARYIVEYMVKLEEEKCP